MVVFHQEDRILIASGELPCIKCRTTCLKSCAKIESLQGETRIKKTLNSLSSLTPYGFSAHTFLQVFFIVPSLLA